MSTVNVTVPLACVLAIAGRGWFFFAPRRAGEPRTATGRSESW